MYMYIYVPVWAVPPVDQGIATTDQDWPKKLVTGALGRGWGWIDYMAC